MTKKDLLDTIFNSEETKPITMLKAFHKFVGVMVDYVEQHAVKGDKGEKGDRGEKGEDGGTVFRIEKNLPIGVNYFVEKSLLRPLGIEPKKYDIIFLTTTMGYITEVEPTRVIYNVTHNLKGNKGDKGDKGDKGEQGIGGVGYYGKKLPLDEYNEIRVDDFINFINENGNDFKFYTQHNDDDGIDFSVEPYNSTNTVSVRIPSGSFKMNVVGEYLAINTGTDYVQLDLEQRQSFIFYYSDDFEIYSVQKPSANGGAGGGIDLNMLGYMNYAADIFYRARRQSLFANAWESSLTVDPLEISENSSSSSPGGKAQYPNGETEGVIIPQGVTTIGNGAFSYWNSNNQPLVIPNSVTTIGDYAFSGWRANNQPLVIPDSVTSIEQYAFSNWSANNQPLVIPDSVTSIGSSAFGYWSANNQPLVIPDSVTSIGSSAFRNWSAVPYVEIQATTPPTLANINAFDKQNNAPIYVPDESVDDYKTATNWVNLANRIFPISDK